MYIKCGPAGGAGPAHLLMCIGQPPVQAKNLHRGLYLLANYGHKCGGQRIAAAVWLRYLAAGASGEDVTTVLPPHSL